MKTTEDIKAEIANAITPKVQRYLWLVNESFRLTQRGRYAAASKTMAKAQKLRREIDTGK